jgi:hypothetical protein
MRPRTLFSLAVVALAMLVSKPAHAQAQYDFTVPFDFVANGRAFKAGQYLLVPNAEDSTFTLEARDPKGAAVVLPVETRLAANTSITEPEVVFDKVEGKLYVSELSIPGNDGYLFLATRAQHTHESLKGSRRKG